MILLFGTITDPILANVCARLSVRDCDLLLINPSQVPNQVSLTWSADLGDSTGCIRVGTQQVKATEIQSAYIRQLSASPTVKTSNANGKSSTPIPQPSSNGLREFVDSLPGVVMNRNRAVCTNGSKPYQQRIIAEHGFRVPRTLITTIPDEAVSFYEKCHRQVIYKSISAERSIVKRLTPKICCVLIRSKVVQFSFKNSSQVWIFGFIRLENNFLPVK